MSVSNLNQFVRENRLYRWRVVMRSLLNQDLTNNKTTCTIYGTGVVYGIDWNTGVSFQAGNGTLNIQRSYEDVNY